VADFDFTWNGQQIEAEVLNLLHRDMAAIGGFLAGHMQAYAPVNTGFLRTSIADSYNPATFTLTLMVGAPYAVYPEFGTRFMTPHPYIRPTIIDAAAAYPWIEWDVLLQLNPPNQKSEPLRATTSGFQLPKHQKLTAAQLKHVKTKLRPVSRSFATKFKRRGIAFKVQGPKRRAI
jgi:hypothetical protein